jgi:chromosome segregation ATPase
MSNRSKSVKNDLKNKAPKILNHLKQNADKIAIGAIVANSKRNGDGIPSEEIGKIRDAEGDIEQLIQIIESTINEISEEEEQVDIDIEKVETFLRNADEGNFSFEGAREFVSAVESVLNILNSEVELENEAAQVLDRLEQLQMKFVEDENAVISEAKDVGSMSEDEKSQLRQEIQEMEGIEGEEELDIQKLAEEAKHTRNELKELSADIQKFMEILSNRDLVDENIYSKAEDLHSQIQNLWDKASNAYEILQRDEQELQEMKSATP